MAGSKSTQTRDNRIYYTSLYACFSRLAISYAPINVDAFVECGMWEIFRLFPSCHKGLSLSVLIQSYIITDYFCNPQKASVGIYSRYDYLLFVYFLILPSLLHSSILFNCFLYLFLFFFIVLSVIYQCHLITTSVQCNYK